MRALDTYLQNVRIAKARKFVRPGETVLDVGCADGAMFERWSGLIGFGYGIDPSLERPVEKADYALFPGTFPEGLPDLKCDVITMLAVLEHIPPGPQEELAETCHAMLNPGGRVVITVPSPRVDDILRLLRGLRLVDGMSLEEHYGFEVERTVGLFGAPLFTLAHRGTFQLGLNNLFVFERRG